VAVPTRSDSTAGPAASRGSRGRGARSMLSSAAFERRSRGMSSKPIYKVLFLNQGKVYEIYARSVSHGGLFGFVEVEKLVFGTRSSVVVDPTEERIKSEFEGVKRTFLPLHSVLRIDEVE